LQITSNPDVAKSIGFSTGINIATLKNEFRRITEGKASRAEIVCTALNIANVIGGAILGDQQFKELEQSVEKAKSRARGVLEE